MTNKNNSGFVAIHALIMALMCAYVLRAAIRIMGARNGHVSHRPSFKMTHENETLPVVQSHMTIHYWGLS